VRRFLWGVFIFALALDAWSGWWLVSRLRHGHGAEEDLAKKGELVQVRESFFTDATHDLGLFALSPEDLVARGFDVETTASVASWRNENLERIPYLDAATIDALPVEPVARARAIALLYSVNGGSICGGFDDLLDSLQRMPQGFGCCSDHGEGFLALGQALGLQVRELYHSEHAFNEFWVPALGKWVFIDTQYALMARDPDGTWLGAFEIRERLREGKPFEYDFFGGPRHHFAKGFPWKTPWDSPYYKDIDGFKNLRLIWGSNIYEQDRFEERLGWMPRSARHVIGHVAGVFPRRVIYEDAVTTDAARLARKRTVVTSLAIGLPIATILPPLLLWRGRRRRGDRLR
jgi:hypothetical protein